MLIACVGQRNVFFLPWEGRSQTAFFYERGVGDLRWNSFSLLSGLACEAQDVWRNGTVYTKLACLHNIFPLAGLSIRARHQR